MTNEFFLDTAYAIALSVESDEHHPRAEELAQQLLANQTPLVTTRAVLLEIGNALSKNRYRQAAGELLDALERDPQVEIVSITEELYQQALALFCSRLDKEWGLIDWAYNRIYQMKTAESNPAFAAIVTQVQNEQLARIEESCGEHAIISLATAFETYYKELLQELLFEFPRFFLSQQTRYSEQIQELIESKTGNSYDQIEVKLKLRDRFHYYQLFTEYSIPLLKPQEAESIEYIYARRNSLVHNAGKVTQRTQARLAKVKAPVDNKYVSTESKRLRTKFKKIINAVDQRIKKGLPRESV